jgi:hypothetical protein
MIMPSGNFNVTAHFIADPALAVAQNVSNSFSVSPNPFSDVIFIGGINELANYKIFSIDGKLIKSGVLENKQIRLDELANGLYLLQITSNGEIMTKKIIKKQ